MGRFDILKNATWRLDRPPSSYLQEYWCVHTHERALALKLEQADIAGIITLLAIRVRLGSRAF
jgi:hypothetical protein